VNVPTGDAHARGGVDWANRLMSLIARIIDGGEFRYVVAMMVVD
jgi:hypothetical protein